MKKCKLRKQGLRRLGKQKISVVQRKLWKLCKEIIRKRYPPTCYTCGRINLEGSNLHTGHMIAKASLGAYLKYDLRILRPQCYHCNINLGGSGADFYQKMLNEIGEEKMAQLQRDRQVIVNAMDHYQKLISEYTKILQQYEENNN